MPRKGNSPFLVMLRGKCRGGLWGSPSTHQTQSETNFKEKGGGAKKGKVGGRVKIVRNETKR